MLTMPYLPNSLFGFLKTQNSFHGVEPVKEVDVQRNLLLYDIRAHVQRAAQLPAANPAAQFKS
jgi:hypothetical protein